MIAVVSLAATSEKIDDLMEMVRSGELRALARAISLVEDEAAEAGAILAACSKHRGDAVVVGLTGPPGAGKSTLVDQLARTLRLAGRSVGIVAIDPTSPFSGGALLGDRIRMQGFAADRGVYIRSVASRGAKGGLAKAARGVCAVLEASGRETILVETIGVGQDEIDVVRLADLTVLVMVPGMGDDVQMLKAGIMEAADIFVINKADRGGAEGLRAEILAMQELSGAGGWKAPILSTSATSGEGVAALLAAIDALAADRRATNQSVTNSRPVAGLIPKDKSFRLDHIGIAVHSIAAARGFYEALGMSVSPEEVIEHERVKLAMLSLGESRLELLEATGGDTTGGGTINRDSTIGRFLAKRGEGIHHIALHAKDIDAKFQALKLQGVRLVNDTIQIGAGSQRYFFIHPASTGGVLIAIVGDPATAADRESE